MNYPREQIEAALFALYTPMQCPNNGIVTPTQPFVTVSRILPPNANVPAALQPALFLTQDPEDTAQNTWGLQQYSMKLRLVVLGWVPDVNTTIPDQVLNPLVDAIDYATRTVYGYAPLVVSGGWVVPANPLKSGGGGPTRQTLGNLVENCFLTGRIKKATGHIGNQTWAVAQVQIVTGE